MTILNDGKIYEVRNPSRYKHEPYIRAKKLEIGNYVHMLVENQNVFRKKCYCRLCILIEIYNWRQRTYNSKTQVCEDKVKIIKKCTECFPKQSFSIVCCDLYILYWNHGNNNYKHVYSKILNMYTVFAPGFAGKNYFIE